LAILYALATSLSLYTLGPLSGGHINPFITLAGMAAGTFSLVRGAAYVVAHVLGSMAGGGLVAAALGHVAVNTSNGGCILRSEDSFTLKQAFALEFMAALILIFLLNGQFPHRMLSCIVFKAQRFFSPLLYKPNF
jgi:glycerol uptake facilitator-like aquaporin